MRNYFGIADMALDWISHYLRNRKFSVHIDSFSSNTKTINFSVPQGSILGPILFSCYVSTLMKIIPENDENFVSGYADDHALINTFHPRRYRHLIQVGLKHLIHQRLDEQKSIKDE